MNIKLVFKDSNFKIDVMEDTPCQYLYSVAQKIFRKKSSDIVLFYGKTELENDSRLLFDVMGKDDKEDILEEEIIIVRLKKDLMNEYNMKFKVKSINAKGNDNLNNSDKQLPHILKSNSIVNDKLKRKKLPIKCQICSHKNSIFYCRQCNMFICFECNIRYIEHHKHKRINLEDGDTKLGVETYKEKILGELKLIDLGYQKFSKWLLSNVDRDNFLQTTFKLLEKIKKSSQRLSDIKTLYNLDQDQIKSLKKEIEKTKIPLIQEELVEIFSNLNAKDKEIENYIKCVDLQIIKTEYNKVLLNCISNAQKNLNKIIEDVESKLHECEDMKFWGINEVKLYLKNNKNEKEDFDIINNLEFVEKKKSNDINTNITNDNKDSSEFSHDSEDDLKKSKKINKYIELSQNKDSGVLTDRKKDDSIINRKRKKKVNIVVDEDSDEEKNTFNKNKKEEKYFNMKTSNSNFPLISLNKTNILDDNSNYKTDKDKDVIKNIISNFEHENVETEFMSPNKRISSIQYPLIMNKLKNVSKSMNNNENNTMNNNNGDNTNNNNKKKNEFKNFKQEIKYGKKLINVLRRKNDNKKD